MTSLVLFLVLTEQLNIYTAVSFLAAFMYSFFLFFILLTIILTEVPNQKIKYYVLGLLQSFIAASIGFSFKTKIALGQSILLGWPYFFIILFIEVGLYYITFWWETKYERIEPKVGTETMIGDTAITIDWNGITGRVSHEGESWKAVSKDIITLQKGDKVIITHVDKLNLTIISL